MDREERGVNREERCVDREEQGVDREDGVWIARSGVWIARSGVWIARSGVWIARSGSRMSGERRKQAPREQQGAADMELKRLGASGVMVPEIGLGTWRYSGGSEPLRRGIELGANLIDTAEMYRTEDQVGEAIAGIRERVFIATKVLGSNLRYDAVLRAADKSLRLLGVDKIDLYQIHWPNPGVPIAETMRAMERLVSDGLVDHIGVSNFSVEDMMEAQSAMQNNPIVSNQILYNLRRRRAERDVIPHCLEHDIMVMAYSPLHEGALVGNGGGRLRRALGLGGDPAGTGRDLG